MLILFLCAVTVIAIGFILRDESCAILEIASMICIVFGLLGVIILGVSGFKYESAVHKADLINKEYGTSYTAKQVFYAEAVVNEVRRLNKIRNIKCNAIDLSGQPTIKK